MNHPKPDNKTPYLLMDLFLSDKPYDPCDLLDPRNSFLFEDDGINESHKGLNPETRTALGPDEDKDDPFHED